MNTKYIKYNVVAGLACCAFSVTLTSCDDLLDPAIENHRQLEAMWDEPSFAQGILANAYILLPYQTGSQSDVATDDAVSNDVNNNYKRMATGSWAADNDPMSQWQSRYNAINYCNIMIENCDKVKWAESNILKQMYNDHFMGESYALRALNYYYLLRAHAGYTEDGILMGVPLILKPQDANTSSDELNQPRATFKECIDQINDDIAKALNLLPFEDGDVSSDAAVPKKYRDMGALMGDYNRAFGDHMQGKINGRIVEGIRAQVAFLAASPAYAASGVTMEQAANQLAKALDRINGVAGIDYNGWKWFDQNAYNPDNFKAGQNPEEIMWRSSRTGDEHSLEDDNFPPSVYGHGRINPSQNLVDAFPMANGYPITDAVNSGYDAANPYAGRDPRLAAYIVLDGSSIGGGTITTGNYGTNRDAINRDNGWSTRTGYYLRKWLRSDVNLNPNNTNGKKHYTPRIRYTELFLDYAEAANEAWGPTGTGSHGYSAYDVILAIRQRAGVGGTGDPYLVSCATDKAKMRELIRNERRLELCFENFRFYDLRRWQVDMQKLNETCKGIMIDKTSTGALTYSELLNVEVRNYKDYMYYGPIPFTEMRKWSALEQNIGWK